MHFTSFYIVTIHVIFANAKFGTLKFDTICHGLQWHFSGVTTLSATAEVGLFFGSWSYFHRRSTSACGALGVVKAFRSYLIGFDPWVRVPTFEVKKGAWNFQPSSAWKGASKEADRNTFFFASAIEM